MEAPILLRTGIVARRPHLEPGPVDYRRGVPSLRAPSGVNL